MRSGITCDEEHDVSCQDRRCSLQADFALCNKHWNEAIDDATKTGYDEGYSKGMEAAEADAQESS